MDNQFYIALRYVGAVGLKVSYISEKYENIKKSLTSTEIFDDEEEKKSSLEDQSEQ
jgi:hypothetical protein